MPNNRRREQNKIEKQALYDKGRSAYYAGHSYHSNPYRAEHGLAGSWYQGWLSGQQDTERDEALTESKREEFIDFLMENEDAIRQLILNRR